MPRILLSLAAVLVLGTGALASGSGGDEPPGRASYQGRTIYLSLDWEGAQACAVFTPDHIECFDSFAEMESATRGQVDPPPTDDVVVLAWDGGAVSAPQQLAADCNGQSDKWLYLYEHGNWAGRALKFNDVNYWQNLTDYGFNDQLSSYWNDTACTVYLAEHVNGGGSWLTIGSGALSGSMPSGWNDRVSSLYIVG